MKKEEISEAMKDIKFTESLMDTQSPEEIKKAFKAKGIDLSLEESEFPRLKKSLKANRVSFLKKI